MERKKNKIICNKKWVVSLLAVIVLLLGTPEVYGTSGNVNVTVPQFKIHLNGITVDNTYRKYPFLVYNDVTYFPMTYYDCRFLGVESQWNEKTRLLSVQKSDVAGSYQDYKTNNKNQKSYRASISNALLKVNGVSVDNKKETYPVLTFRGVTYFPMTWKYGVESFGWDYRFDKVNGLMIHSKNTTVTNVTLPLAKISTGMDDNPYEYHCILAGNHYFYEGKNGAIYMTPVNNLSTAKKVYQLPPWSYGDGKQLVWAHFTNENGKAVLHYHQGGASMGYDAKLTFSSDGTYKEETEDYFNSASFVNPVTNEKKVVSIYYGMFSQTGNLSLSIDGAEATALGDPQIRYSATPVIDGDFAYVVGGPENNGIEQPHSNLYKINLTTNEIQQLTQDNALVTDVALMDQHEQNKKQLFAAMGTLKNGQFTERSLYSMDLDGKNQKKVASLIKDAPNYIVLGSNVYYT
ncbi:MAG: kelch repeat-containing protein, partial [Anaerovorax sp.]|nr:kelch repeat-containing protein [Anaerovorax sp.]